MENEPHQNHHIRHIPQVRAAGQGALKLLQQSVHRHHHVGNGDALKGLMDDVDTVKFIGIVLRKGVYEVFDVFPEFLVHQGGALKLRAGQIKMAGIPDSHSVLLKPFIQCSHIVLYRGARNPELPAELVDL